MNCLFCNIVAGRVNSYKVYEDELVYAFLDIHPFSDGHTLIIPKTHFAGITDINLGSLNRVAQVAQKLAIKYANTLHADGFNLLNSSGETAQQDVFHFHMHLIPRYRHDSLTIKAEREDEASALDKVLAAIIG